MSPIIPQKQCPSCKEFYPPTREYFSTHKAGKDGLNSYCKPCAAAKQRDYRRNNPEKVSAIEQKRDRDKRNKQRRDRLKDPEYQKKVNDRATIKRQKKLPELREYMKQYRKENPEKVSKANKEWIKNNPEKVSLHSHKKNGSRRVRMLNASGSYTVDDLKRLYDEQEGRCAYCGISIYWSIPRDIHVDHIKPLSKGGSNNPYNLNLACHSCNESKADKELTEWLKVRGW